MDDTTIVRQPGQNLAETLDPSVSVEDAEIDALLTEAETRMRESAASASAAVSADLKESKHKTPKLRIGKSIKPYIEKGPAGTASITDTGKKAKTSTQRRGKPTELPFMRIDDPVKVEKEKKEKRDKTAGPDWYNMPATQVTPQIKRDLQMIKLRNVLDPHKHFKGDDWKGQLPKYFQMGTLVEGPTEFYSARINKKERKKSIVDEILASNTSKSRFKKKYDEIQAKKKSGKKEFYKKLREKRRKAK
ncbi:hypothetical protein ABW19_dt0202619 [Dactylella cylindrospora]|nr:hypothetical protein ABW19_dt0202619 [Dactylella cylindrospora]